ncbi:MAG: CotH kinase family protein [Opitutales bacterium]|nr:CotH kinase family protein [Opitutales bacterium]
MTSLRPLYVVLLLSLPGLLGATVVLNEFVASNGSGLVDEDGDFSDWIEILNTGEAPVDLEHWGLSDRTDEPFRWRFPQRSLAPGAYLVVYASGKDRRSTDPGSPLHTNFSIAAAGEPVLLTRPDGTLADIVPATPLPRDVALGRSPDGTGPWRYFLEPTPGAPNTATAYSAPLGAPEFSHTRGFYDAPFTLTLSHPDTEAAIFFTTDGRDPATHGIPYTGPLSVETTTTLRAMASAPDALPVPTVATHTFVFLEDVIAQDGDPAALGMPPTWGGWPHTHYGMSPLITQDPAYASRMRPALESVPILSVVIDPDDLFHPSHGLYANRGRRGVAWERPVSVEWLHSGDADAGFQVDAGLRIQGGASRFDENTPKSSFRLLFKNDYGASRLVHPFFGVGDGAADDFNTIVLRAEWNNSWLYPDLAFWSGDRQRHRGLSMRDQFIRHLERAMTGHGSRGNHAHLFINGLYWGLYNPSERIDAAFGASYFGGEREDWDAITHDIINSGGGQDGVRDGTREAWDAMMAIANAGLAEPAQLAALEQYLDIPRFIDYMILQLWAGNSDWPHNNVNAIRRREPGAGFLFFIWDAEHSLEELNDNRLAFGIDFGPGRIFNRLLANPEFKLHFADRVHRHFFNGGALTPERLLPLFDESAARVGEAVIAESARWGTYYLETFTGDDFREQFFLPSSAQPDFIAYTRDVHWQAEYDRLRDDYLPHRTAIVLDQFRHPQRGLYPAVAAPVFSPHGGTFADTQAVVLSAAQGTIYYTLDGSDPRTPFTGELSPSAVALTDGTTIVLEASAVLRARTLHNGQWSALNESAYTAAPLVPHILADGPYHFSDWSPLSPAGTYPAHMLFEQTAIRDAGLAIEMDAYWTLPYNLTNRSRINGLGTGGIGFINTGNAQDLPGAGYLGAARLALDTTGVDQAWVRWTGGTVTSNDRVYGLRLQYRVGASGPFSDLPGPNGDPVEYIRHEIAGHSALRGPVALPAGALGHPYVELRWKYYHISGTSGPRAQLRLADIRIETTPPSPTSFAAWRLANFSDASEAVDDAISGPLGDPRKTGLTNLKRYALGMGAADHPHARLPRIENRDGQPHFCFPFDPNLGDLAFRVEASADMVAWDTVLFDSLESPYPPTGDGWLALPLENGDPLHPLRFARLRVDLLPTASTASDGNAALARPEDTGASSR